ncbi:MAG: EutN/CcmL family microcompartment protein [Myxococcales bacterium]|nr:EutN/CcmL family microcompartment protein [Myxococcales bacterium]
MRLAQVIGTVVSTVKHPSYVGQKVLLCQPLTPDGQPKGDQVVAIDRVQAGPGDRVLILTEGNGVRQLMGASIGPVRSLIVGIVDEVTLAS